jgi:hypothetical protein
LPQPLTVLIAAANLLPPLKARLEGEGDLLTFTDADALRALDAITKRRPSVVALERQFSATPRGAALISRLKADPVLHALEIRIVSLNGDDERVSPRHSPGGVTAGAGVAPGIAAATAPVIAPAGAIDKTGTRRAPRFKLATPVDITIDGNQAALIDLSAVGAQVVSAAVLKPNQRIRMALTDDRGSVKFSAVVAWASFEIPAATGPRYRAGINFLDADQGAVEALCLRHKAP